MIEKVLKNIGLNEKEIEVYLTNLELGAQPASTIARRVKIPRNTTRFILDTLVEKGIIKKSTKANTQFYTPEAPKNLTKLLEIKRTSINEKYDEQIKQLKSAMSELKAKYKPETTKPKVKYYEGTEGMIKAYEQSLKASGMMYSICNKDAMKGKLPDYFKTHSASRRAKNKIPVKSIRIGSPLAYKKSKLDKVELRESRLLPPDKYSFTPEILFYNNSISMTSWKEELSILIESQEIREAFEVIFDLAWKEAEKIDIRRKTGEKIYKFKTSD